MATVNGITAEHAQDILDQTITDITISGSTMNLVRHDGSTSPTGDFSAVIDDQVSSAITAEDIPGQISAEVSSEITAADIPGRVAGSVTARGSVSTGAALFTGLTNNDMINKIITATLTANITITTSNIPASPRPGTQFAIVFTQDATGGRTLTLTGIKKSQGVLALTTAANAIDIISFLYDGTNWYAGAMGVAFS